MRFKFSVVLVGSLFFNVGAVQLPWFRACRDEEFHAFSLCSTCVFFQWSIGLVFQTSIFSHEDLKKSDIHVLILMNTENEGQFLHTIHIKFADFYSCSEFFI